MVSMAYIRIFHVTASQNGEHDTGGVLHICNHKVLVVMRTVSNWSRWLQVSAMRLCNNLPDHLPMHTHVSINVSIQVDRPHKQQ